MFKEIEFKNREIGRVKRFTAESYSASLTKLFKEYGASDADAKIVSENLVKSDLQGHASHGIARAPLYISKIKSGDLNLSPSLEIEKETPTTAVVNGDWGFGQVIGLSAIKLAIEKASRSNIACVVVKNSNHVGRLGEFTEKAAREGFLAIATANLHGSSHVVAPYGGIERKLPTNPISIAAPKAIDDIFLLDMSTSVISEGKLKLKYYSGEKVCRESIINSEGKASEEPADFYDQPKGAILPLGGISGYKGYGLALAIDILSGALSEAGCSRELYGRHGNACMFILIRIESFIALDEFCAHISDLEKHVKSSRIDEEVGLIQFPGEPERQCYEANLLTGIEINETIFEELCSLADERFFNFSSELQFADAPNGTS